MRIEGVNILFFSSCQKFDKNLIEISNVCRKSYVGRVTVQTKVERRARHADVERVGFAEQRGPGDGVEEQRRGARVDRPASQDYASLRRAFRRIFGKNE